MRESRIEKKVSDYAKSLGWLCYKFSSPGNRAVPDRIYMRDSIVFFIEFKAPGKEPSKLQTHEHIKIGQYGVRVFVIDDTQKGIELFDKIEKENSAANFFGLWGKS